jgi:hypothetical protein
MRSDDEDRLGNFKNMGAHENLEHAEHAAHSASHGAKHMGLTMALLAVLIAFAAAMVGSQRQELMTSLLDQSWAHSSSVAANIKSRMTVDDLNKLRAGPAASAPGSPDLPRLLRLDAEYAKEYSLAQKWDDSCEPLIDAHYDAAEGYEHAQVIAEVGIILASLGILLASRTAWIISVIAGVLCIGQMGYTYASSRGEVSEHHDKVHAAEHAYDHLMDQHLDVKDRQELLDQLDPGGKIRATLGQHEEAGGEDKAANTHSEEKKSEEKKPDGEKPEGD